MILLLKRLCQENINVENQWEICLQIGFYEGHLISLVIQIAPIIVSSVVALTDKTFYPQVIKKVM